MLDQIETQLPGNRYVATLLGCRDREKAPLGADLEFRVDHGPHAGERIALKVSDTAELYSLAMGRQFAVNVALTYERRGKEVRPVWVASCCRLLAPHQIDAAKADQDEQQAWADKRAAVLVG